MVPAARIAQGPGRLEIAVGFLCGEDDRYPPFECGLHPFLRCDDRGIAFWIDHQGFAHGFHGLVDPGIGKDIALVFSVGFAAKRFCGFDEIVEAALAGAEVGALALGDAPGDPVGYDDLCPIVPEPAIDAVMFCIDNIESFGGRRDDDFYAYLTTAVEISLPGGEAEPVNAGGGEG